MQINWEETLKEQAVSGLSVSKFCQQNSIAKPTFYYWKKKLNQNANGAFLHVDTQQGVFGSGLTEILYPNGVKLRLSGNIKIAELKALLNV